MEHFEDALERVRLGYHFAVAGYVVMPEHVHLLVNEPSRGAESRAFIQDRSGTQVIRLYARTGKAFLAGPLL